MSSMDMSMSTPSASSTSMSHMMSMTSSPTATAASSTSSGMSMGGMDMGEASACKISMLWNWYTVDTCFLSSSWHVTSKGMFAGSCIGVVLLVLTLEFLRRLGKEYDRKILREHQQKVKLLPSSPYSSTSSGSGKNNSGVVSKAFEGGSMTKFRPTIVQQAIRALLHMLAFAVAYFVMLLAMYYNGYIIICILIGAFLGFFIFGWESVELAGPEEETTVCCG